MGVHQKIYTLTDGQRVTINQVMEQTGIKQSAARVRIAQSRDPDKILAPKGTHLDYGYGRLRVHKKTQNIIKVDKQKQKKIEKYITQNKPFYVDEMYRLALKKISYKKP